MYAPDAYVPAKCSVPYKKRICCAFCLIKKGYLLFAGNLKFIINMLYIVIFNLLKNLIYLCQQDLVQNKATILGIYQTITTGFA